MSTRKERTPERALARMEHRYLQRALAAALLVAALPGCGSDSRDDATPNDQLRRPVGSAPSRAPETEDFMVACWDESAHECREYLGEEAQRAVIEAETRRACRLGGNVVQATRCSTEQRISGCRDYVKLDNVRTPIDTYYYAPLTEADAEIRCQGEPLE